MDIGKSDLVNFLEDNICFTLKDDFVVKNKDVKLQILQFFITNNDYESDKQKKGQNYDNKITIDSK